MKMKIIPLNLECKTRCRSIGGGIKEKRKLDILAASGTLCAATSAGLVNFMNQYGRAL